MNAITAEKLEKYFKVTEAALAKAKLHTENSEQARKILDMASRYVADAHWFAEQKDEVNAFAALNYAHGWLDCGATLGILNAQHDSELFSVD